MFDRIAAQPGVCAGRTTVRGLRLTVEFVPRRIGDGYTAHEIVRQYPELQLEDILQAAQSGAWPAGGRNLNIA